jgi:hypothetical protein
VDRQTNDIFLLAMPLGMSPALKCQFAGFITRNAHFEWSEHLLSMRAGVFPIAAVPARTHMYKKLLPWWVCLLYYVQCQVVSKIATIAKGLRSWSCAQTPSLPVADVVYHLHLAIPAMR